MKIAAFASALLLCALPTMAASIVANGDFETGDLTSWTQTGDTGFTGVNTASPHSGTYSAYFGSLNPSFLTQDLTTVIGQTYQLTFYLQNNGAGTNSFSVSFNGVTLTSLSNQSAFAYTLESFGGLVATSTTTTLQFSLMNSDSYWRLDDVAVNLVPSGVPEPGTFSLLLAGLGTLGWFARRRRA